MPFLALVIIWHELIAIFFCHFHKFAHEESAAACVIPHAGGPVYPWCCRMRSRGFLCGRPDRHPRFEAVLPRSSHRGRRGLSSAGTPCRPRGIAVQRFIVEPMLYYKRPNISDVGQHATSQNTSTYRVQCEAFA